MKFKLLLTISILLFFVGCSSWNQPKEKPESPDWPMVHKNLQRTGSFGKSAIPPLQLKWKFKTNGPIFSSPAVVNGIVYFLSDDSTCYALDAKSGTLKWKMKVGQGAGYGDPSPVISNGIIYAGEGYALKTSDGSFVWHNPKWGFEFPAFVKDSSVFYTFKRNGNELAGGWYKIDAMTGKELMLYNCCCPEMGTTVVGNRIFTYDDNGEFLVYHTDMTYTKDSEQSEFTILKKSKYPLARYDNFHVKAHCSFAASKNRIIYFPGVYESTTNCITAIDLKKLSKDPIESVWETQIPFASTPSISDEILYTGNGPITALDIETGKIIWKTDLPRTGNLTTPAVSENWVYISSQPNEKDGYLYILDGKTGKLIDKHLISKNIKVLEFFKFRSSPAIVEGWVYVGSVDGCLYAFQGQEQKANNK